MVQKIHPRGVIWVQSNDLAVQYKDVHELFYLTDQEPANVPESVVKVIEDVIEKYEIISHSKTKAFIKKKLFGCRICEKRFKTKGSLKNHKSLYHNNLKMELSCPLPDCESRFI